MSASVAAPRPSSPSQPASQQQLQLHAVDANLPTGGDTKRHRSESAPQEPERSAELAEVAAATIHANDDGEQQHAGADDAATTADAPAAAEDAATATNAEAADADAADAVKEAAEHADAASADDAAEEPTKADADDGDDAKAATASADAEEEPVDAAGAEASEEAPSPAEQPHDDDAAAAVADDDAQQAIAAGSEPAVTAAADIAADDTA